MCCFWCWIGLFVLSHILPVGTVGECPAPSPCTCSDRQLYCSSKELGTIPTFDKSMGYFAIDLRGNRITRVEDYAFSNLSLSAGAALVLDLSDNPINYINDLAFAGLENASLSLALRHTNLEVLPKSLRILNNLVGLSVSGLRSLEASIMQRIGLTLTTFTFDMKALTEWPTQMKYLTNLSKLFIRSVPELPDNALSGLEETLIFIEMQNITLRHSLNMICNLHHLDGIFLRGAAVYTDDLFPICERPLTSVRRVSLTIFHLDTSHFPGILATFPGVSRLTMSYGNIKHVDEAVISSPNNITYLHLEYNNLTRVPYAIRKMNNLIELSLSNNYITSIEGDDFSNIPKLEHIDLRSNPLDFISEFAFKNSSSIRSLDLRNTNLEKVPRAILHMPAIQNVRLSGTQIKCNCDMVWLSGLTRLPDIQFDGDCYRSTDTIFNFVHSKLLLCETSPVG